MAFVSRTTRDSNRVGFPQQAGGDLGPGTYDTQNVGGIKVPRPSFTAFGSTTGRSNLGAAGAGAVFVTPGPGNYQSSTFKAVRRERGSSNAFKSKTQRFKPKKSTQMPGPGAYSVQSSFKVSRKKRLPQPAAGIGGVTGSTAPVTWVRVASAPSIPAPSQSYGYEEGEYGELIMQKAPRRKPQNYDIRTKLGGKNARAADWARSRTTRIDFTKNGGNVPGPGQYQNTDQPQTSDLDSMEPKNTSSFASKSSRLGANEKKKSKARRKRETRPGPGQYRIKSSFVVKHKPESLQFFGSTSRRFQSRSSSRQGGGAPGPGSYDVANAAQQAERAQNQVALRNPAAASVGFTSTSSRFSAADHKAAFGPSPGSYDPSSTMIDEMNKKLVSRTGVFGSTTRRFATIGSSNAVEDAAPPPSQVLDTRSSVLSEGSSTLRGAISGRPRQKAPLQPSAAFASQTRRGASLEAAAAQAPPPGTYDVNINWTKQALRGGKGVLGSGSQRFKPKAVDNEVGPGAYYNPKSYIKEFGGGFVSKEERFDFKPKTSSEPGPGSYSPEYLYGNLNKRTFNMTIAEQEALA